jgi:hypothetical protein
MIEISPETAEFLLGLVNKLTLEIGAPDFDEAVQAVLKARTELTGGEGHASVQR